MPSSVQRLLKSAERLYGEAWTTVLPSISEAFGLVLVELVRRPAAKLDGAQSPARIEMATAME